jgi:hypothetical protein
VSDDAPQAAPESEAAPEAAAAAASAPAAREPNALIRRVDALIKRQQEEAKRSVEEVPLLTEIVERDAAGARAKAKEEEVLAADLERALLVRLVPEINKQVASLRSELEKDLRKAVREAIALAIAERRNRSPKE